MAGQGDPAVMRRTIGRLPGGAKLTEVVKGTFLDCNYFIEMGATEVVHQVRATPAVSVCCPLHPFQYISLPGFVLLVNLTASVHTCKGLDVSSPVEVCPLRFPCPGSWHTERFIPPSSRPAAVPWEVASCKTESSLVSFLSR